MKKNKRESEILGLKGKQSKLSREGHEKFRRSPEQGSERGSWQGSGERLKDSQMEGLCMCKGPEGQEGGILRRNPDLGSENIEKVMWERGL